MSVSNHQETFFRRGEALYTQNLDDAFDAFKKVILLCDCNKTLRASSKKLGISSKDIPLPICHCKDYLSLPIDNPNSGFPDKEAVFNLSTQPCSCGSGLKPCHNRFHIKALTSIANVYVAQKAYSKAVQFASLAITLAPHFPEGYLRLVTIIRQRVLQCTPDLASRCNWLDTQASHSVRAHGDKNHEFLKPIGRRIRRDIVRGVPVEVRQMILRYLPRVDICRAMRVSRAWKLICRDPLLWRDLKLVKNWRHNNTSRLPFPPGVLNNIVKLSGHMATSLTIDGLWDFKIDDAKLGAMLNALPELRFLSLSGRHTVEPYDRLGLLTPNVTPFKDYLIVLCEDVPKSLTTLHLNRFDTKSGWTWDEGHVAETGAIDKCKVTEANLVRLQPDDARAVLEVLLYKRMETLLVKDCNWGCQGLDLTLLIRQQSCVSSMDLDGVMLSRRSLQLLDDATWEANMDRLTRLTLGDFHWEGELKLPTSDGLLSLELNKDGLFSAMHLMWRVETEAPFLPRLKHFRCHFDPHKAFNQLIYDHHLLNEHDPLFAILQPSIKNGALFSLDLTFSKEIKTAVDKLYEADQKQAIRVLACHDIIMPSIVSGFGGNCDEFLDWVETFPNLTTIGVYPQMFDHAYSLIFRLMNRRSDIKTIYTNVLRGAGRDRILAEAGKRGVTIIHADRVPEPDVYA